MSSRDCHDIKYKLLITGYCRRITKVETCCILLIPSDIICIIIEHYNEINVWRISKREITTRLCTDFTTIDGRVLNIRGNKFISKLKRSRDRLYFGVWYQGTDKIENALTQHFKAKFPDNHSISNTIIESFKYVIQEEEFDDIQLILHDFEDVSYSCILEYVETKLLETQNVSQKDLCNIKLDIRKIISEFNSNKAEFLNFRVKLTCTEIGIEFMKLFSFNKNEIAEKGAEWQWRSPWNEYKDSNLSFQKFIDSKAEYLTFTSYVDVIQPSSSSGNDNLVDVYDDDGFEMLRYEYVFDEDIVYKLSQMKHCDHIYPQHHFANNTAISSVFGYYYGNHYLIVNPIYPTNTFSVQYVKFMIFDDEVTITNHKHRLNGMELSESDIAWKIDIELIKPNVKLAIQFD